MPRAVIKINKISKKKFDKRLQEREYENISAIEAVENFFIKKRGYVFKMPRPGSEVILLTSGGLDSTIVWGILMEKFNYKVYPLFLHRGLVRKKREKKAVDYFSNYYQKKYPVNFVLAKELTTHLPPPEIEKEFKPKFLHPEFVLENYYRQVLPTGTMPYMFPLYGVAYSKLLQALKNKKVKTIFSAVAVGDGTVVPAQTFTAQRTVLLDMCIATNDYTWQYASFAIERELGHWLEKSDLIKLGSKMNLPLERTWSCYESGRLQCGECLTCMSRKKEFAKVKVADMTRYKENKGIVKKLKKVVANWKSGG